ncbi:MAG: type 4b pilus protein PilO2, partial [Gemmobacter sp.]
MRRARTPPPDPARPVPASASGVAEAGGGAPAVLLAPGVIAVGRARFAVGLLWQLRDEVRTLAEQVRQTGTGGDDLTLYTPHSGRRQIGLATPRRGARRGMRAGAANLDVASAGQAWLAVFRLDSRLPGSVSAWWIVAERGALIYEDRILFDEGEARSAFAEAAEAPGWQRILCPPAWGIPGADASDIALAMPLRPKGGALRPVSAVAAWAPRVAMAAILLILAAGGWFSYALWQAEQTRLAEELARIERAARLARPPPAPPWVEAP